jgi:O-antigen ligase
MAGVVFLGLLTILYSRKKLINILIVLFVLMISWVVMPQKYKDRFLSISDISFDYNYQDSAAASASGRIEGVRLGVQMVLDRPLFGYGIGQYAKASKFVYGGEEFRSHSIVGQILGDLGVFGVLAFIFWLYTLFKTIKVILKYNKNNMLHLFTLAILSHIYCLLFLGLGGHNLYRYSWIIISALLVAIYKIAFKEFLDNKLLDK